MSVKKALLVLPEPPLPFGGAAARWYHSLLKGFSDRDIHATVLTCTGNKEKDEAAKELHGHHHELQFFGPLQRDFLSAGRSLFQPFSYPFSVEMRNHLYGLRHDSFDLIQFETHFTGWLMDRPIPGPWSMFSICIVSMAGRSYHELEDSDFSVTRVDG